MPASACARASPLSGAVRAAAFPLLIMWDQVRLLIMVRPARTIDSKPPWPAPYIRAFTFLARYLFRAKLKHRYLPVSSKRPAMRPPYSAYSQRLFRIVSPAEDERMKLCAPCSRMKAKSSITEQPAKKG